ncbi:enoyl-CoA hydratase-related protein [Nocardia vinacea]|uniref:Enoyl-CoA hydratase domain-containing protein 3, mitochondrial n=1 Tax=Nocardia vinacea TaxID=96468 RepID=A0ABZ1YNC8_9NOCA|nr:enoyl-CoA hydratase-related protein [Nocardia vinacea]
MTVKASPVSWRRVGHVGVVTMEAPERRNPLSVETMLALTQTFRTLGESDLRAIVLAATGPVFSAGHDMREMLDRSVEEEREIFRVCTELMETIQAVPQPVVAAVQGPALAAGCQLVATCDLAVAATTAVFGTPGVRIGLFCSTPMVAVSRAIGRKRALQMLMTGTPVDAATAAEWGLINEAVEPEVVFERALELAQLVANASPLTLEIGKQAFYHQIDLPQAQAYESMREVMASNAISCDAQEGMNAFLEKRSPTWVGR